MIPKIILPETTVKLHDDTLIHVNPYQIGDEKALLNVDTNDFISTISAMANLVKKCVKEDINVDNLIFGELMWIYLHIHAISVLEYFEVGLTHDKIGGAKGEKCQSDMRIYINQIKYEKNTNEEIIPVNTEDGTYNLILGEPTVKDYTSFQHLDLEKDLDKMLSLLIKNMVNESGDNAIELTTEDKLELVNSLDAKNTNKMIQFYEKMSKPYYDLNYTCPHCGKVYNERIYDFFM